MQPIVGLDIRSTMDLDTTLRNLTFTEDQITQTVQSICNVALDDEVNFSVVSITPIREDDRYGGFCVRMDARYDTIITPLSIDISTGDVLTPSAVHYEFSGIFDESVRIGIWGYIIETVMAEKVETILSRGVFSTRPRDYYDIYILGTTQKYDKALFWEALSATANHRESKMILADREAIFKKYPKAQICLKDGENIRVMDIYKESTHTASQERLVFSDNPLLLCLTNGDGNPHPKYHIYPSELSQIGRIQ